MKKLLGVIAVLAFALPFVVQAQIVGGGSSSEDSITVPCIVLDSIGQDCGGLDSTRFIVFGPSGDSLAGKTEKIAGVAAGTNWTVIKTVVNSGGAAAYTDTAWFAKAKIANLVVTSTRYGTYWVRVRTFRNTNGGSIGRVTTKMYPFQYINGNFSELLIAGRDSNAVWKWGAAGTAVSAATAGVPDVNVKNWQNVGARNLMGNSGADTMLHIDIRNVGGAVLSTSTAQLGVNAVNIGGTAASSATIGTVTHVSNIDTAAIVQSSFTDSALINKKFNTTWHNTAIKNVDSVRIVHVLDSSAIPRSALVDSALTNQKFNTTWHNTAIKNVDSVRMVHVLDSSAITHGAIVDSAFYAKKFKTDYYHTLALHADSGAAGGTGLDSAHTVTAVRGALMGGALDMRINSMQIDSAASFGKVKDAGTEGAFQVTNATGPGMYLKSYKSGYAGLYTLGKWGASGIRSDGIQDTSTTPSHAIYALGTGTGKDPLSSSTVLIVNQDTISNRDSAGPGIYITSTNGDGMMINAGGTDITNPNRAVSVEGMVSINGRDTTGTGRQEGALNIYSVGTAPTVTLSSGKGSIVRYSKNDGSQTTADTAIQLTGGSIFLEHSIRANNNNLDSLLKAGYDTSTTIVQKARATVDSLNNGSSTLRGGGTATVDTTVLYTQNAKAIHDSLAVIRQTQVAQDDSAGLAAYLGSFAEYRTLIKRNCGINTSSSNWLPDSTLDAFVREGAIEVGNAVGPYKGVTNITTTYNTMTYPTDSLITKVLSVIWKSGDSVKALEPKDKSEWRSQDHKFTAGYTGDMARPDYYSYIDGYLSVYPVPSSDGDTIQVTAWERLPNIKTSSSINLIPQQYRPCILKYATWKAAASKQHPLADEYKSQYEASAQNLQENISLEQTAQRGGNSAPTPANK